MSSRLLVIVFTAFVFGCQDKKVDAPAVTTNTPTSPAVVESPPLTSMIRGKVFTPDRIEFEGRRLTFAKGKDADTVGFIFELPKIKGISYEGKSWTFAGNNRADPLIDLRATDDQGVNTSDMVWGTDYTMTLKILKQEEHSIEGTIDLKMKNAGNTYLTGKFTAVVKQSSGPPDASAAPFVHGTIDFVGDWKNENLSVGFAGKGDDGKPCFNSIGFSVSPGFNAKASSEPASPQVSTLLADGTPKPSYRHTKLVPGEYVFYLRCNHVLVGWKKLHVKADDQLTLDFTIDPSKMGDLSVTLPEAEAKSERPLLLTPEGLTLPAGVLDNSLLNAGESEPGEKRKVKRVPAGKYTLSLGKSTATVEVVAGKETAVTLK